MRYRVGKNNLLQKVIMQIFISMLKLHKSVTTAVCQKIKNKNITVDRIYLKSKNSKFKIIVGGPQ